MQFLILTSMVLATAAAAYDMNGPVVNPYGGDSNVRRGKQCSCYDLQQCQETQQAWGCVDYDGAQCVDQTKNCDSYCVGGYAYTKHGYQGDSYGLQNNDDQCLCSYDDASQSDENNNCGSGTGYPNNNLPDANTGES